LFPIVQDIANTLAAGGGLAHAAPQALARHPTLGEYFSHDGPAGARFGARDDVLFPGDERIARIEILDGAGAGVRLSEALCPADIQTLVSHAFNGRYDLNQLNERLTEPLRSAMETLHALRLLEERPSPALSWPDCPRIVRMQHASVLLSGGGFGVIADPHFQSEYEPPTLRNTFRYPDVASQINAALITHSHADHFDIPSLMMLPRTTPIVVPRVPRANILAPDMKAMLQDIGFSSVIEGAWHSTVIKSDGLEVIALPFFGEQPLRHEHPRDIQLRSWGNTYLVRTARYSAWLLVDAGADASGSMQETAHEVRRRHGPVDFVLSNLREFYVGTGCSSPRYIAGGGHYWMCLTGEQMQRFHLMNEDLLTLGPAGVAEVARIVGAKYVLPYAHWWRDLGTPDPGEDQIADEVRRCLASCRTEVLGWRPGDALLFGGSEGHRHAAFEPGR
jgi:L-ascorbate metabolism protein UlaG (beta-lactamase superfamily)